MAKVYPDFGLEVERRVCKDCAHPFTIDRAEVAFFRDRSLRLPDRCHNCRRLRRLRRLDLVADNVEHIADLLQRGETNRAQHYVDRWLTALKHHERDGMPTSDEVGS